MRFLHLRSVNARLLLAFIIVSLFGIVLAAAYVSYTTTREFHTFADARNQASFLERWAQYYRLRGSWDGVENALSSLWPPPPAPAGQASQEGQAPAPTPDPKFRAIVLVDAQGQVVLSGLGHDVGEQLPEEQVRGGLAIEVDGQVVGTLIMRTRVPEPDSARDRFLARFSGAWLIGGGGAMLVALLLSLLLSRSITRPLEGTDRSHRSDVQGRAGARYPGALAG